MKQATHTDQYQSYYILVTIYLPLIFNKIININDMTKLIYFLNSKKSILKTFLLKCIAFINQNFILVQFKIPNIIKLKASVKKV